MVEIKKDDVESKELADLLLGNITEEYVNKIMDLCGENFYNLYRNWREEHGVKIAQQWVKDHGGRIVGYDDIGKLLRHLAVEFIKQLES